MASLKGKRVLITGGLGFIGSNLAHKCVDLGAEVCIYDCLDPRSGGNLFNIQGIKKEVTLINHSILNFDQVSQYITNKDIVFNCAASTSHPFSMREPWLDLDVNGRGVINLLEAVRRFNPEMKVVHIGTTTQLGRLVHFPANETHPEFPTDIYSANKCLSEKYVLIYSFAHNLRCTVVRLPNVYGPRATINSAEFTFNNFFIGLALQNRPISIFGNGNQKRNILYIDDAVTALLLAATNASSNQNTFFAASDDHYSVREIAEKIIACMQSGSLHFIEWPPGRKETDVNDAIISNKKIKEMLNWHPRIPLEDGLGVTKDFYKKNIDHYLR